MAGHVDRYRPGRGGVERQGYRLSLSHITEGEWRATFMGAPMFSPAGFGVAETPWRAVQREASAATKMDPPE